MSVLLFLIPLSLLMATASLVAFVWVVRSGQLDDLTSPPARMLADDLSPQETRRP